MNKNWEDYPVLHLYPQETWHGNAAIVGNRKGLEDLRDAIDATLKSEDYNNYGMTTQRISVVPEDGETHYMDVHHLPTQHDNWRHLPEPYAENMDRRMKGDDQDFLMPPSWGAGIVRRLDSISTPVSGFTGMPDELMETFLNYHELSDEEKRDFKEEMKEWETSRSPT